MNSTPRYSVLLPTYNGGSLLDGCMRSILDQTYDDFELVISDNASTDSTPEILTHYSTDPRVRLLRQHTTLGVTDNWNATLNASTGKYIAMLGDDDALLPGYFERLDILLGRFENPDVLLFNCAGFAHPGQLAGSTGSYYCCPYYTPPAPLPIEGELSPEELQSVAKQLFRFVFPLSLAMQTALISRSTLSKMPGDLFKPPFPDFYALASLMLSDVRWAISPEVLVVAGVSPKSFGSTMHATNSIGKANNYLGINPHFAGHLPGNEIINGHCETLLLLKEDFGEILTNVEINRREYVLQQVYAWYIQYRLDSLSLKDLVRRFRLLGSKDWLGLVKSFVKYARPKAIQRRLRLGKKTATDTLRPGWKRLPEIDTLDDFLPWLEAQHPRQSLPETVSNPK